jgi:hypothetical protein
MGVPYANETNVGRIVRSIIELWQGRSNAVGEFTLTPSQTSTVVEAMNCGPTSRIALTPRTANAAGALSTTYIAPANVKEGQFTVTHASAVSTDRTYGYSLQG